MLKKINSICGDINKIISQKTLTSNQAEVLNIIFIVNESFTGKTKTIKTNNEGTLEIFEEESSTVRQKTP